DRLLASSTGCRQGSPANLAAAPCRSIRRSSWAFRSTERPGKARRASSLIPIRTVQDGTLPGLECIGSTLPMVQDLMNGTDPMEARWRKGNFATSTRTRYTHEGCPTHQGSLPHARHRSTLPCFSDE